LFFLPIGGLSNLGAQAFKGDANVLTSVLDEEQYKTIKKWSGIYENSITAKIFNWGGGKASPSNWAFDVITYGSVNIGNEKIKISASDELRNLINLANETSNKIDINELKNIITNGGSVDEIYDYLTASNKNGEAHENGKIKTNIEEITESLKTLLTKSKTLQVALVDGINFAGVEFAKQVDETVEKQLVKNVDFEKDGQALIDVLPNLLDQGKIIYDLGQTFPGVSGNIFNSLPNILDWLNGFDSVDFPSIGKQLDAIINLEILKTMKEPALRFAFKKIFQFSDLVDENGNPINVDVKLNGSEFEKILTIADGAINVAKSGLSIYLEGETGTNFGNEVTNINTFSNAVADIIFEDETMKNFIISFLNIFEVRYNLPKTVVNDVTVNGEVVKGVDWVNDKNIFTQIFADTVIDLTKNFNAIKDDLATTSITEIDVFELAKVLVNSMPQFAKSADGMLEMTLFENIKPFAFTRMFFDDDNMTTLIPQLAELLYIDGDAGEFVRSLLIEISNTKGFFENFIGGAKGALTDEALNFIARFFDNEVTIDEILDPNSNQTIDDVTTILTFILENQNETTPIGKFMLALINKQEINNGVTELTTTFDGTETAEDLKSGLKNLGKKLAELQQEYLVNGPENVNETTDKEMRIFKFTNVSKTMNLMIDSLDVTKPEGLNTIIELGSIADGFVGVNADDGVTDDNKNLLKKLAIALLGNNLNGIELPDGFENINISQMATTLGVERSVEQTQNMLFTYFDLRAIARYMSGDFTDEEGNQLDKTQAINDVFDGTSEVKGLRELLSNTMKILTIEGMGEFVKEQLKPVFNLDKSITTIINGIIKRVFDSLTVDGAQFAGETITYDTATDEQLRAMWIVLFKENNQTIDALFGILRTVLNNTPNQNTPKLMVA
jgi:hypothetical protein